MIGSIFSVLFVPNQTWQAGKFEDYIVLGSDYTLFF